MESFNILNTLNSLPGIVIGLTVHEFAHAYTAYKLGDSTAKDAGRISLNPIKHIDPLGFILIIFAGFGWAKPVMFNPEKLKKQHRDEILISIAGPISNLVLAILFFVLARVLLFNNYFLTTVMGKGIINIVFYSGVINIMLFVFNMLPLPPLDGSHLYLTYIKKFNPELMNKMYRYGTIGLLVIILFENQTKIEILPIMPVINFITSGFISILGFN